MNSVQSNRLTWLGLGLLAGGAIGWMVWRAKGQAPALTPEIAEKLPIAKDLPTIADASGNYDIDGVSFDSEGVIVSSDGNKEIHAPV